MINVQFSDSSETEIVAYFASPQDPEVYSNLGVVASSDARWKEFFDSTAVGVQPSLPQPTSVDQS